MAIPGLKADESLKARGKIRVGITATSSSGKSYPKAVDYFVSDDPEVEGNPSRLLITLPYATAEEVFSTGLEWWTQTKEGKQQLACYTKDGGANPVALRLRPYVNPDDEVLSEDTVGANRVRVVCRNNDCPMFGQNANNKKCRPMGRLQFFIAGGRTDAPLQFDTKAWGSIRSLSSSLTQAERGGPLNAEGRVFSLCVVMESKGRDKFPTVYIEEVQVEVNTSNDVQIADALVQLRSALDSADDAPDYGDVVRRAFAAALDVARPGWRENQSFIDRIKEIGVMEAAHGLLARYGL